MVDNFDIIRAHLDFKSEFDRYIVHILKRAKDDQGVAYGSNETNRLIKTFYITSLEYFDKKIPVIKDLCDSNLARVYILPQVRSNEDCLKELLKIVVDNLSNPSIKPDHLIRSAFCGFHGSRAKRWIIDYDYENSYGYDFDFIVNLIKENHIEIGNNPELDMFIVPTKNGKHIVTKPFNLEKCFKKCDMLYQGVKKIKIAENIDTFKNVTGFLIKDGMTLLYIPESK